MKSTAEQVKYFPYAQDQLDKLELVKKRSDLGLLILNVSIFFLQYCLIFFIYSLLIQQLVYFNTFEKSQQRSKEFIFCACRFP